MPRFAIPLLILLALLGGGSAAATSLTVAASYRVTSVSNSSGVPAPAIGDAIRLTYVFETSTPDADPDASVGDFPGGVVSLELKFNTLGLSFRLGGSPTDRALAWNDHYGTCGPGFCLPPPPVDILRFESSIFQEGDPLNGSFPGSLSFEFIAVGDQFDLPTMLSGASPPSTPLTNFDHGLIELWGSAGGLSIFVPEPDGATLGLVALLVCATCIRRADHGASPTA